MKQAASIAHRRRPISFGLACLALLAVGLCAHILLVFTDYILWDGYWYYAELMAPAGPQGMVRLFSEIGRPLDYYTLLPFEFFSGPVPPKIAGVVAWILAPVLMFYALERGAAFPRVFALVVAIVAAVAPVFDVLGEIALWMNTIAFLGFWCGFAVLIKSDELRGVTALLAKATALLFFLFSFNLNSLLVFYYAVALFLLCSRFLLKNDSKSAGLFLFEAAGKYWVFAIAPICYWVCKSLLAPVHGYFVGYNQPTLSLERVLSGALSVGQFLLGEISECLSSVWIIAPALLAAAIIAAGLGRRSALRLGSEPEGRQLVTGLASLLGGAFLLLAGAFPYAAVDQALSSFGWLSRNCILTAFPISLFICGAFSVLNTLLMRHRPNAWLVPIVAVVVISIAVSNRNYLQFQALGAKQDSIGIKLQKVTESGDCSVVQLRDYFIIPDTIYYYAPIVWTYIAAAGASHPKTFVFDIAQAVPAQESTNALGERQIVFPAVQVNSQILSQMLEQTSAPYMLRSIPLAGTQKMFIVQQGKYGIDGVAIGARYLWLKWFRPDHLSGFLNDLTETAVLELPSVSSG